MFRNLIILTVCASVLLAGATQAVYTPAQAAAGKAAFNSVCAQCHTDQLTGHDGTGDLPPIVRPYHGKIPPLAGENAAFTPFLTKWGPRTTADLSKRIADAIGGFKPTGLTPATYLEITAYVLQANGAPSGSTPLAADTAVAIDSITTSPTMPPAQQNALVGKYCVVCHTDKARNGGLSLEQFDAAHFDPPLASMMASKLHGGAMGAAGVALPDRPTQNALLYAFTLEGRGADRWNLDRTPALLTLSIVEQVPSHRSDPDLYRLTLTCPADSHTGQMQLAWSPGTFEKGRVLYAAADSATPTPYTLDSTEPMPIGGDSAPGAIALAAPLPKSVLTVKNLFDGETVSFSFSELPYGARQELSRCFAVSK